MNRISVIFLLLVTAASAAANDSPQTSFFRANALYAEGNYAGAIGVYEGLVTEGFDGGHLRFNLGNAYFKAGDLGPAILNYERAGAWNPDDPDVAANLAFARSLSGDEPCSPAVWTTLLFPLASRLSTWTLAVLASAAFTVMLVCLALRHVFSRPRRVLGYAAGLSLVILGVSAASAGYRFATEDFPLHAVVIAAGETPVRFEPDSGGTTHFVARQGTRLEVGDQRDGWVQVGRCDGRRGWIEAQTIETL